jgi:uncharacterized protein (TIGR02246 family)
MLSRITVASAISAAATLVLIGIGSAQAQDKPADVRAAIEASNKRQAEAVAKKDAASIAATYTPDALYFLPNKEPMKGRQAIQKHWQSILDSGVSSLTVKISELESSGDLADEVGTYEVKNKQGEVVERGNYCVVWKRVGGQWLLHRDISTSMPVTKR